MILRGYIDESKGGDIFNLTAVIADGGTWFYFEQDWINIIGGKNAELKAQGRKPISRYHATDAQFRQKEFKGWERDEKDQFCISLFKLFEKYKMHIVGYSINLKDMVEEIPESKPNPLGFAYPILLCYLMLEIGDFTLSGESESGQKDAVVSLVHDRCDYDAALKEMFDLMLVDPGFKYANRFTTLESAGWENCVPLQAVDFFAYENFKESQRLTLQPRDQRRSLKRVLTHGLMGGRLRGFDRSTLKQLKERIDATEPATKRLLFATARISPKKK